MRPVKTFYKICYYVTVELDAQTLRATAYVHSCILRTFTHFAHKLISIKLRLCQHNAWPETYAKTSFQELNLLLFRAKKERNFVPKFLQDYTLLPFRCYI